MGTTAEEHAVDAFSSIMRTPLVDLMRKRLVTGLRKDDAGVVVRVCILGRARTASASEASAIVSNNRRTRALLQADVDAATRDLTDRAPAPEQFSRALDRLARTPKQRDQMVLLMSRLSKNPSLLSKLAQPEDRAAAAPQFAGARICTMFQLGCESH